MNFLLEASSIIIFSQERGHINLLPVKNVRFIAIKSISIRCIPFKKTTGDPRTDVNLSIVFLLCGSRSNFGIWSFAGKSGARYHAPDTFNYRH